ncbi:MAG: hypothetical protein M9894_16225 [Planctomycetes bacterium]|nr:hypothetical protein [Planctomycetota bacterium]
MIRSDEVLYLALTTFPERAERLAATADPRSLRRVLARMTAGPTRDVVARVLERRSGPRERRGWLLR